MKGSSINKKNIKQRMRTCAINFKLYEHEKRFAQKWALLLALQSQKFYDNYMIGAYGLSECNFYPCLPNTMKLAEEDIEPYGDVALHVNSPWSPNSTLESVRVDTCLPGRGMYVVILILGSVMLSVSWDHVIMAGGCESTIHVNETSISEPTPERTVLL